MTADDFIGDACVCGECVQAGVTTVPTRRDPRSGMWLHGHDLRRWYEAREKFRTQARAAVGKPGRHAAGFEDLTGGSK